MQMLDLLFHSSVTFAVWLFEDFSVVDKLIPFTGADLLH